ncbi:hypothetical protein GUJ93_ZPchr0006g45814 [Zizania palustris]|uniref:Uncharacterized protein n=1 Tax=Zizania palustris TaxID=103762 RepID=A0A8J5SCY7_ZIZPA|nr:hypothetical protein GUJ93_ZPchr0006g45814 [Zizania palustris]
MGCFLGCFGGAKERRRRRKRSPAQSPSGRARTTPRISPKKAAALDGDVVSAAAPLLATLLELRDSTDDLCLTVVKKKVTFDPNVTTYEADSIPEEEEEEAEPAAGDDKEEATWMLGPECAKSEAFPLNHRYSNCADGEYEEEEDDDDDDDEEEENDEEEEDGLDECAIDDEDDDGLLGIGRGEDEACESLFLLPMGKTKESSCPDAAAAVVTSPEAPPPPHPTRDGNPVLSSVENLSQWKEAKSRAAPKALDKENMVDLLSEPAIPAKKKEWQVCSDYTPSTPSKQEASVDASLSTWLGSSGTPESNSIRSYYSPISREDRPILGALTVEDIKISSANSSPRRSRSPSPSPDDMPILGTVGAYWNCSAKAGDPVTRGGFMRTRTRFAQNFA